MTEKPKKKSVVRPVKAPADRKAKIKAWVERRKKKGLCLTCGEPKRGSPYRRTCVKCAVKARVAQQKARGSKGWKKGSRGRPPRA